MYHEKTIVRGHSHKEMCAANNKILSSAELANGLSAAASNQLFLYSKCSA